MNPVFDNEFAALIEKYSELLTGDSTAVMMEKVKKWALYNQIHKTMPALTNHWGSVHPEAKAEMRRIFEEVRAANQALKQNQASHREQQENQNEKNS